MSKRFYTVPSNSTRKLYLWWTVWDAKRKVVVPNMPETMSRFEARRAARSLNRLSRKGLYE